MERSASQMVDTGFDATVCLNSQVLRNSEEQDVPLRETQAFKSVSRGPEPERRVGIKRCHQAYSQQKEQRSL